MSDSQCPSPSDLIAFAFGGDLDVEESDIPQHLNDCEHCKQIISALETRSNPLVEKLRGAQPSSATTGEDRRSQPSVKNPADDTNLTYDAGSHHIADPLSDLEIAKLSDFKLIRRLGSGGMGTVYLAQQLSRSRLVAIKTTISMFPNAENLARFRREANLIDRLEHSGIPKILYLIPEWTRSHIVMTYVPGSSLRQLLDHLSSINESPRSFDELLQHCERRYQEKEAEVSIDDLEHLYVQPVGQHDTSQSWQPLPFSETARQFMETTEFIHRITQTIRSAAKTIHYAHAQGLIHRDIKPSNIMLSSARVYVIDFGLSRSLGDAGLTTTGRLVGTPRYMSPEQFLQPSREVGQRSDVYSLGISLYEALTGEVPFLAKNIPALLQRITTQPIVPVRWVNPSVSEELERVVHKATAKAADDRYPTAESFAKDLEKALAGQAVQAPAYRYRYSPSEVVAQRPVATEWIVLWLYYAAIFYGSILLPLELGQVVRKSFTAIGVVDVLAHYLVPAVGSGITAWHLARGASWARWITIVVAMFLLMDTLWYLSRLSEAVKAFGLLGSLLQYGHLITGRFPLFLFAIPAVTYLVRNRQFHKWIKIAYEAKQEFRQARQTRKP